MGRMTHKPSIYYVMILASIYILYTYIYIWLVDTGLSHICMVELTMLNHPIIYILLLLLLLLLLLCVYIYTWDIAHYLVIHMVSYGWLIT